MQYAPTSSVSYCYDAPLTLDGGCGGARIENQGKASGTTTLYASGQNNGPIGYWGNGAIRQVNFASGTLSQSFGYNSRFWPTSVTAAAGSTQLLSLGYTYFGNGNVQTATIVNAGLGATLTQTFDYDGANRLTQASEAGGPNEWSQCFGYDPYGNQALLSGSTFNPYSGLTPQAAGSCGSAPGAMPFSTNNQWVGAGYDGAGNQTGVLATGSDSGLYDAEKTGWRRWLSQTPA